MKVRNYELTNDGVLLYISHKGKQYFTEYTPEIEALFASGVLGSIFTSGIRRKNYPKFEFEKSKREFAPYLHHVVYCVHYRNLTEHNYMDVLRNFRAEISDTKSCIDHLHDGVENCCISNLNMMSVQEHYKKTATEHRSRLLFMSKKATFFHVIKANDGNCIRVQIAYSSSSIRQRIRLFRLHCETDKELVDLLTHINAGDLWNMVNERMGVVCNDDSYTISGGFLCYPKVIPQKPIYSLQHDLLQLELSEFSKWETYKRQ